MVKKHKLSIFIFRRDLRLFDNIALIKSLDESDFVMPCFIFDPRQIKDNKYKSDFAIQFMIESLQDLDKQLKQYQSRLYLFNGNPDAIIRRIFGKLPIDAIYLNCDYTPFSKIRDELIEQTCKEFNVEFNSYSDLLLTDPLEIHKKSGNPFANFSSFFKKALEKTNSNSQTTSKTNFYKEPIGFEIDDSKLFLPNKPQFDKAICGGRTNSLKILDSIQTFKNFENEKDYPILDKTTKLSPHLKFGNCSIREVFNIIKKTLGIDHPLIRQLYWREFFTHIAHYNPYVFGNSFYQKFDKIKWESNSENFKLWCEGRTGFPIVDAGMRQLKKTGFISNRMRMIVASFLIKDLHIDWRLGEQYFAQKLVDYDPSVNNGNWQWVASTGCCSQPYFKIMNPWVQQKKFDPESQYIKKWVSELEDLPSNAIQQLVNRINRPKSYPKSIVNHRLAKEFAIEMFKKLDHISEKN
jgi:deoxyribodipyrimidine photo-lyase